MSNLLEHFSGRREGRGALPAQLDQLRQVPPRSPAAQQAGLQAFLAEAASLRAAVSSRPARRHTGWTIPLFAKERSLMTTWITLVLVAALALGGGGATALAAQGSLPPDRLYPVKLWSEDLRLGLAAGPQAELGVLLALAQERVMEMTQLAARGQAIPEAVPLRLQTHLEHALQRAAGLDDAALGPALERIRLAIENQLQLMEGVQQRTQAAAGLQAGEWALVRAREMAQLGLRDPAAFRAQVRAGQTGGPSTPPVTTPGAGGGPGPFGTPSPSGTPLGTQSQERNQEQHRNQAGPSQTPGPGPQSGTPAQHQNGPNGAPAATGTNGPGPGPQATACGECTPVGDQNQEQHQNGPQATQTPGAGPGPGPNQPATPCQLCTPQGDENHNGPGPGSTAEPGAGPGPQPTEPAPGDGQPGPQPSAPAGGSGGGRP